MPDIDTLTDDEIIEYLKNRDSRKAMTALSVSLEKEYNDHGIYLRCPNCDSSNKTKNGKNKSGVNQYICKDCGKKYSALTNTIFEGTDFTWNEMVDIVHHILLKHKLVDCVPDSRRISRPVAWLVTNKILHIMASFPQPILNDIVQIDEKYFRENQKGSRNLVSFLDNKTKRYARKHNFRSECGIFGPEFVNVLCAVDSAGHYYAKCVCLGPMSDEEITDLEQHLGEVSYICTDNYALYSDWAKARHYKHYVEPSTYRKERLARGYINTDDIYKELTEAEYAKDKKINEQLYKEGRYPHIENAERSIDYDEFIALKYKFKLSINRVNSFHNLLEGYIVKARTGVSSSNLEDYVGAFAFMQNYKTNHSIDTFTKEDANRILTMIVEKTLAEKHSPTREELFARSVDDLPRPTLKAINRAKQRMKDARRVIQFEKIDSTDLSAYEGDSTAGQFLFNQRKFLENIGAIRLNELVKQYGLYERHINKREKINRLCALDNIQDIIFYEIYLHNYGTNDEFQKAISALPAPKKRGRPKKKKDIQNEKPVAQPITNIYSNIDTF